jgi:transcriptional regulator with XRE-family HTH domain
MLTAAQIRAARALLRWSSQKLSKQSGLSLPTIQRMESAEGVPTSYARNLGLVQEALEAAGIEFIDENGGGVGVRFRDRIREP